MRGKAEGGRFIGSTNDSGPMKPGNSVEDKTLTTGCEDLDILSTSMRVWEAINER